MKASLQHLGFETKAEGLDCFWVKSPRFGFHWHYHPELEITYVHQGQGTRLVGDSVQNFENGDFVFMGSNLPHTWVSDDDFNQKAVDMEVVVLQFPPSLFSEKWLALSELSNIRRLLYLSKRGVVFSAHQRAVAKDYLLKMVEIEGFERFVLFLRLLDWLGQETNPQLLASQAYIPPLNAATEERLLRVCTFVHENFTGVIKLEEAAQLANMNPTSFCRFFKKSTGQSFMDYVNDLRIGKACNLLLDKEKWNVSEVAYRSGFNSQTFFNRLFLKKKGMSPRVYRSLTK